LSTELDTSIVPSRPGYTFLGWSTSKDATSATYPSGSGATLSVGFGGMTLYAVWEGAYAHTLTYDANDSTFSEGFTSSTTFRDGTATTEVALAAASDVLGTRPGYTCSWNDATDGTGNTYAGTASVGTSLTLYATWTPNAYALTYRANVPADADADSLVGIPSDGLSPTYYAGDGNGTVNDDGTYTAALPAPLSLDGYDFLGWDANDDGAVDYGTSVTSINLTTGAETTLTALWAKRYALGYSAGAGVLDAQGMPGGAVLTVATAAGAALDNDGNLVVPSSLLAAPPTRPGYTCLGWSADGEEPLGEGDSVTIPAGGLTLTAVWQAVEYTLVYDAVAPEGVLEVIDSSVQNAPAQVSRSRDASDEGFDPENETYTVAVSNMRPTCAGYAFEGWWGWVGSARVTVDPSTDESASTVTLPAGKTTLHAKWTAIEYSLTCTDGYSADGQDVLASFDAYAIDASPAIGAAPRDETFSVVDGVGRWTVPLVVPARDGYTFVGWQGSDGTLYPADTPAAVLTDDAPSLALTAVWAYDYSVAYDANGGRFGDDPDQTTSVDAASVTDASWTSDAGAQAPVRPGYALVGWATSAEAAAAGTVDYDEKNAQAVLSEGDPAATLYAVWTPKTYTLSCATGTDANEAAVYTAESQGVVFDAATEELAVTLTAEPARDGYEFVGWDADGDGEVDYLTGDTVKLPADGTAPVTLAAVWDQVVFELCLLDESGAPLLDAAGEPIVLSVRKGATVEAPAAPEAPAGKVFLGWRRVDAGPAALAASDDEREGGDNATADLIQPGDPIPVDGYIYLRAVWGDAETDGEQDPVAGEEAPADKRPPVENAAPADGENPAEEEAPSAGGEEPAANETPAEVEKPAEEPVPAASETPAESEAPARTETAPTAGTAATAPASPDSNPEASRLVRTADETAGTAAAAVLGGLGAALLAAGAGLARRLRRG
jgi:uncharacterized repeat protein (TIGR02543 family)